MAEHASQQSVIRWQRIRALGRRAVRKLFPWTRAQASPSEPMGFHGDPYLLKLVGSILQQCAYFVETGTHVGSTLAYVARTHPNVTCLSCEPSSKIFHQAVAYTRELTNAKVYNEDSGRFLKRLRERYPALAGENALFWLDAHGQGFKWPLLDEVSYVTTKLAAAYALIDDFRVPGRDYFGYDTYREQACSFEYIQSALNRQHAYDLYYPAYPKEATTHKPLRGWVLIAFGRGTLAVPPELEANLTRVHVEAGTWQEKHG